MLQADTLAYVPYPWDPSEGGTLLPDPVAVEQAWVRRRGRMRSLATLWVDRAPTDADAMHALATSLEMLGDPAAIDSLRRARELETREPRLRELAATQAWVMIKQGLRGEATLIARARTLADSLLATTTVEGAPNPMLMASLAAVTGRVELAVDYEVRATYQQASPPEPHERAASEFTLAAAAGAPPERLSDLEARLLELIDATRVAEEIVPTRRMFVERGAILSFPDYVSRLHDLDHSFQSPVGRAASALHDGDLITFERELAGYSRSLHRLPAAGVSIDAIFPEYRLLLASGDTLAALETVGAALRAPDRIEPGALRWYPVRAVLLTRILREAGALGVLRGEPAAEAWERAARTLEGR